MGVVASVAVAVAIVHSVWLVWFIWQRSDFVGDDVVSFSLSRQLPFWRFLATPIDVHWVPLHRLGSYLLAHAAPLRFGPAFGVLVGFHALGVVLLYRTLELIRSGRRNLILTAFHALHPCLGTLLHWWSAGLHRLPYVCCSLLALHCYVRFRIGGPARWLFAAVLASAAALGFYGKAILIPVYLVALELAFFRATHAARLRRNMLGIATLAAPGLAYIVVWHGATTEASHRIVTNSSLLGPLVLFGLRLDAPTFAGAWVRGRESDLLSLGAWGTVVFVTALVRPAALLAWAGCVLSLAANWAVIALSVAKTSFFGLSIVLCDRYYFELSFLLIVFTAVAFRDLGPDVSRMRLLDGSLPRWTLAVVAVGVLLGVEAAARESSTRIAAGYTADVAARRFLVALRADLDALPPAQKRPLSLVEGPVPSAIVPVGSLVRRESELVSLLGLSVHTSPKGVFRITASGHLERRVRWVR